MPSEDLKSAAETLETAAQDFRTDAGSTFGAVSERLQQALEAGVQTDERAEGVVTRLQEVLGDVEDVRTQDLAATLVLETGVIEGVQAPEADIGQIETVTDSIASYVREVDNIQNAFSSEQLTNVEAQEEYNVLLQESVEALNEQADAVGLTDDQVQALVGQYTDVRDVQKEYLNDLESSQSVSQYRQQFQDFTQTAQDSLEQVEIGAFGVELSLIDAFTNPKAAILALAAGGIALLINEFSELDNATQEFISSTGVAASEVDGLRENAQGFRRELTLAGLQTSDLIGIITGFGEEFGSIENAAQDIQSTFRGIQDPVQALQSEAVALAGRLNLSGDEAAGLITQFQELAATTDVSRQNLQASALEAANLAGVAPKDVFQDIAENSEKLAQFSGQSGERLASAAAQARALGTNIGEVAGLQEKILTDIPGFIQGIEQASALSPEIALDPGAFARAAAEGTPALVAELESQLGGRDFSSLDFFTKQRLQDALGLSAQEIQRIGERADNASLSFDELTRKVQEGEASLGELFQASEGATALTELQRQAGALGVTLLQAVAPALELIAEGLTSVVKGVNRATEFISTLTSDVREAGGLLRFFGSSVPGEELQTLNAGIASIPLGSFADEIDAVLNKIGDFAGLVASFAAVGGGGYLLVKLFKSVTGAAGGMAEGLGNAFKGIGSGIKSFVSGAVDAIFGGVQKILDGTAGIIDSLSSVVNSVVDLVGQAFVKALRFAGQGVAAFVSSLTAAAPGIPILAAITAAALGLGGALYFAAPAIDALVDGIVSLVDILVGGALEFVEQLRMTIVSIGEIGPQLFVAAGGVTALASSLLFFATALSGAGFASAVSNFANLFGGGPIDKIERLAAIGPQIQQAGDGIRGIAEGLEAISALDGLEANVDASTEAVQTLAAELSPQEVEVIQAVSELQSATEPAGGGGAQPEGAAPAEGGGGAALSAEDRELLRSIDSSMKTLVQAAREGKDPEVYVDGKKVTDRVRGANENNLLNL
jgi:hypothetical protein